MAAQSSSPSLDEQLDKVNDRESFFTFVRALIADKCDDDELRDHKEIAAPTGTVNAWENYTISAYLDAALAWAETKSRQGILPDEPSWRTFAAFLYAGKIWE